MKAAIKPLEVSHAPELLRLAQEVQMSGQPYVLKNQGEEVALLTPLKVSRRTRKSGLVTLQDALWNIVGIGASDGPTDTSINKHRYLAEAYTTRDT